MQQFYDAGSGWVQQSESGLDRARQFGDGLFETIRLDGCGNAPLMDLHLERLALGLRALRFSDAATATVIEAFQSLTLPAGPTGCKLLISRGTGARGYGFSKDLQPDISASFFFAPAFMNSGMRIGISEVRLSNQPLLAGHKHLNRLEQVLAREAFLSDWQEALMFDYSGLLIEGCMSNVFLNVDGEWLTPELTDSGIRGVVRRWLMERHPSIREVPLSAGELAQASAVVLTNSLMGIRTVSSINDRTLSGSAEAVSWQKEYTELFDEY